MKKGLDLIKDIDDCVLEDGKIAFWWLGQLGYVIKIGKTVVYLDAFLSENVDRNVQPLLKPQEVVNADIILGTHDHEDHIDRGVWHQLSISSPNAKFVVSKLLIKSLSRELNIPEDRFIGLDDGMSISEANLKISGIASAHEFLDQDLKTGIYPYLGYIIEGNGCVLYHSGDTCLYEGMYSKLKKWGSLDIMFIPINGRDAARYNRNCIGNMTYQEAVDLAGHLKPGLVVPGHYEMFSLNSEDPLLFKDYLEAKYPGVEYWIGNHGDRVLVRHK
ncbi:MBL fold metallo-hydrolase [Clostridium gelidum]|uniref:MBL fold metallo-hydrolase n=1 Tax=Clostridium gelidum TaxID=704125 RepID=A0ABM7TAL6_9CLOT|nr:MBL fold metallo-hydrolase [Clostridium gelidum]BCZ45997.1 MBL fold metallo-hydrolase [Clostridium gelidum]